MYEARGRRVAEDALAEERRAWARRETAVREEASKTVLSDLANVLTRAAQAPSSMWNGIGGCGKADRDNKDAIARLGNRQ